MSNVRDLEGYDELVERLLTFLTPEEVQRHYKPEERLAGLQPEEALRHYGLDLLLRHLRNLTPAEQAELERPLPPDVLAALRQYLDKSS